ncbi:MAG: YaiI/YqxD family protein [Pikeienuella sp.]|uniref:YaiI/YqxD family protein n=1 Tax=Pikeienuella sp. TaxID=2831957 RepID=UPI00391A3813
MTVLYVDADACPVKAEALRVAERHKVRVVYVADGGLRPNPHPLAEVVIVPGGLDAADDWIAERIGPGDICVTADIPLADRCVKAGARAMRPDGELWTAANIGNVLATRNLMAEIRAANPLNQGGGGRPFSKADRSRFLEALEREMRRR